jgi:predicted transcriptional regulator
MDSTQFARKDVSETISTTLPRIGLAPSVWNRHNVSQLQRTHSLMKTKTIPSLRVDPALRSAAESVLRDGESLSSFMEKSLRANIERRQMQKEFLARGLASRDDAKRTGEYVAAEDVLRELDDMLADAETKAGASA